MTSFSKTSDSVDGEVSGQDASHATARSTSFGSSAGSNQMEIGQTYHDNTYFNSRGAVRFDCAAIPLGSTINNAQIKLTAQQDLSVVNFDVELVPISGDYFPLASFEEEAYDEILAAALDVVWRNTSGMALNTPYTSPDLTDLAHIVPGALVSYGIRSSRDKNNNTPTGDERIKLYCKNNGTVAYEPTLLVDYTTNGRRFRVAIVGI